MTPVTAVRHEGGASFLASAGDWLLRDEAAHNLILGIAGQAAGADAYFCTLEEGGDVTGCAVRVPPRKIVLTSMGEAALRALADDLTESELPAAFGPRETVRAFAAIWSSLRGVQAREGMRQRLYRLDTVTPPQRPASGEMRWANDDDLPLVQDWLDSFLRDAMAHRLDARLDGAKRVQRRELALWVDGAPCAMAGYSGRSPNGVRIGYVYTPRELRGRGYASALVARLSSVSLAEGARFCFLYTDLDNPVSNSIYQRIGYMPVEDALDVHFT